MKKYLLILLLIFTVNIKAQQVPLTSQYMFNQFVFNPGAIGNSSKAELRLSSRRQWVNIDGAPVTNYLSFHKLMNNKNMGLGAVIYSDQYGPEQKIGFKIGYSYILPLDFIKSNLGIGLAFNGYHYTLDYTQLIAVDVNDPNIQQNKESVFIPDADIGFLLYNKKYSFGVSTNQLINTKIKLGDSNILSKNTTIRHYNITMDYVIPISERFDFVPASYIRFTGSSPIQADVYLRFLYLKKYWAALTYRTSNTLSFLLGLEYNNFIIGYSYDYDFNEIKTYSTGSHEIVLGYNFSRNFYTTSLSKSIRNF